MQEPTLRRAGPTDAEILATLGAATFTDTFGHLYPAGDLARFLSETYAVARVRADLADARKAFWLAEFEGEPLGYALAGPCDIPHAGVAPQDGELKRLYLVRNSRNLGLGARLFDAALEWLHTSGPRTVWIGVWAENAGAQRFYARRGFEKAGEYGFRVGGTVDREFVLRRTAESFSNLAV